MLRVLIAYGTSEGQTGRIAEYLANVIRSHGHEAFPVDVERANAPTPDGYDAVIVGGSIHMGRHERNVVHLCAVEPRDTRASPLGLFLGQPRGPRQHR